MQTSVFAFFSETGGILPPRRQFDTSGRTMPTRIFVLHQTKRAMPTANVSDKLSPKLRNRYIITQKLLDSRCLTAATDQRHN
jgi:hypothetical protein